MRIMYVGAKPGTTKQESEVVKGLLSNVLEQVTVTPVLVNDLSKLLRTMKDSETVDVLILAPDVVTKRDFNWCEKVCSVYKVARDVVAISMAKKPPKRVRGWVKRWVTTNDELAAYLTP